MREHGAGRVVARDTADAAAPARAGAAQPHVRVLGLDPPRADLVVGLRKRPRQVAVEDVPARHAELGLDLGRRQRLEARRPVGGAQQAVLERLGQRRVERAERGVDGAPLGAVVGEQPRRHVQPEQRERLRPRRPQLVRQDARIGQRVAVDLARRHGRDATGAGLGVGGRQLLIALVDVERPRERFLRAGSRHARQALEQHVDLELGSLRGLARRGLAEQPAEHVRCDAGEHVPGAIGTPVGARDLSGAPVGGDRHHLRAGDELGSGSPRGAGERGRQRPHASHRHVPAAADDVVQEAPVLAQQRVVGRSERPDQAVGQDRSAG